MGLFKKQPDPITDRARALNAEIAALEAKIKKLNTQVTPEESARPRPASPPFPSGTGTAPRQAPVEAPIFEKVDNNKLKTQVDPVTRQHFNEKGVQKFDFVGLIDRIKSHFQGPPLANPKLVNYLAAGSIQGLRSLRYEKRVARNRFIAWTVLLVIVLMGTLAWVVRQH